MTKERILKYVEKCKSELVHKGYLDGYTILYYKEQIKKYKKILAEL